MRPALLFIPFLLSLYSIYTNVNTDSQCEWGPVTIHFHGYWDTVTVVILSYWSERTKTAAPGDGSETPFEDGSPFSNWPRSHGLYSPGNPVRVWVVVPPEKPKQGTIVENMRANWPGHYPPQERVRVRMGIAPENKKEPPVEPQESTATVPPFHLSPLWGCLAQVDVTCLLCRAWQILYFFCIAWIVTLPCRNWRKPQRQARRRMAASSRALEAWRRDILQKTDLLCRMEYDTALTARNLRREYKKYLKALRKQQAKRNAPE